MLLYPDVKNQRILTEHGYSLVDVDRMAELILENNGTPPARTYIEDEDEAEVFNQLFNIDLLSTRWMCFHVWWTDVDNPSWWMNETDKWSFNTVYFHPEVDTDEKRQRVKTEMDYFDRIGFLQRELPGLIHLMSNLQLNDDVWGVGRGSMCASYVFYLWGITDIDPIEYDIPFSELSKEIDE